MITTICNECGKEVKKYPSQIKKSPVSFCNKSCARTYSNKLKNPSWTRDLRGKNNPMWGKHPEAWNKDLKGEKSHNWKGGIHKRKDGYVRININGERKLLHRYILQDKLEGKNIVHHIDHNPSNNDPKNLQILPSQSEHATHHMKLRHQKNKNDRIPS